MTSDQVSSNRNFSIDQVKFRYLESLVFSRVEMNKILQEIKKYSEVQGNDTFLREHEEVENVDCKFFDQLDEVKIRSIYKKLLKKVDDEKPCKYVRVFKDTEKTLIFYKDGTRRVLKISPHSIDNSSIYDKQLFLLRCLLGYAEKLEEKCELVLLFTRKSSDSIDTQQSKTEIESDENKKLELIEKAKQSLGKTIKSIKEYRSNQIINPEQVSALEMFRDLKKKCSDLSILTKDYNFRYSLTESSFNNEDFSKKLFGETVAKKMAMPSSRSSDEKIQDDFKVEQLLGCGISYETDLKNPKLIKIKRHHLSNGPTVTPNVAYIKIKKFDENGNLKSQRNHRNLEFSDLSKPTQYNKYCYIKITFDNYGNCSLDDKNIYTCSSDAPKDKQKIAMSELQFNVYKEIKKDMHHLRFEIGNYLINSDMRIESKISEHSFKSKSRSDGSIKKKFLSSDSSSGSETEDDYYVPGTSMRPTSSFGGSKKTGKGCQEF